MSNLCLDIWLFFKSKEYKDRRTLVLLKRYAGRHFRKALKNRVYNSMREYYHES